MKKTLSLLTAVIMLCATLTLPAIPASAFERDGLTITVDGEASDDLSCGEFSDADGTQYGLAQDAFYVYLSYDGAYSVDSWQLSGLTEDTDYVVLLKTERLFNAVIAPASESVSINAVTKEASPLHTFDIYEDLCDTPSRNFKVFYHGEVSGSDSENATGLDGATLKKYVLYIVDYTGEYAVKSWDLTGLTESGNAIVLASGIDELVLMVSNEYTGKVSIDAAVCKHTWDGGASVTAPTCGNDGETRYTCTVCGKTRTETVPATGKHTWGEGETTVAPTCVAEGTVMYRCTVCSTVKTESVPATGEHNWFLAEGYAPTCVADGYNLYHCRNCNETKRDNLPATGVHTWGKTEQVTAPTCVDYGLNVCRCQVCNKTKETPVKPTGKHTPVVDKAVPATFKSAGKTKGSHCSVCGKVIVKQNTVAKLKGTEITALIGEKKSFTVNWKKSKGVDGYQVQYSLKKNMSSSKTVTVKGAATLKKTVNKLKKNKSYYVRVRAYKTINGKKQYSSWSTKKSIKTK